MVQWFQTHESIAGGAGSIPGQGTKIPYATRHGPRENQADHSHCVLKYKFNKVFDHVLIHKLSTKTTPPPPQLFRAIKSHHGVCEHQLEKYRFRVSLVQYCQLEIK